MTKLKRKASKNSKTSKNNNNTSSNSESNSQSDSNDNDDYSNSNNESISVKKPNKTNQVGARKSRQRQENSLGELTKNFIKYIREKGNRVVHINDVVKKLKVKKRRIYDITNVLEGKI
jgi:hypothetical protein